MKSMVFLVIGILLIGCTHFEVSNEIKPKVTIIGKEVGLVYKLGNLTIADTIKPDKKKREWLSKNMENIKWTLYIKFDEVNNTSPYFRYYVNGIKLLDDGHTIDGVSEKLLLANMDNIPGFHLYTINGKEVGEEDEEIIQKEIIKVKEEVKESGEENKYKSSNDIW